MQAALVILALSSISATLSAETGSPLAPDRPVAGSLNDALTPTPSFVTSETEFFLKSHGTSRRVLRRKDSLMSTVLAAAASAAAILAVAFLVLQCFKALGKASRAAYSSRRLANSNKGSEGLDCGVSRSAWGVCSPKVQLFAFLLGQLFMHSGMWELTIRRGCVSTLRKLESCVRLSREGPLLWRQCSDAAWYWHN